MLNTQQRINALVDLTTLIKEVDKDQIFELAKNKNGFFIPEFSGLALSNVLDWNNKQSLQDWAKDVPEVKLKPKKVGLILAGNIPLVGWHDLLTVFISGNIAVYKPSTNDEVLIDWLVKNLISVCPEAKDYFIKSENMKGIDAIIATGSSSSALHFHYYFKQIPRLIRGSKSSLGLLYGFENQAELELLADDIFLYFGLGCRNVSKILVPEDYDFDTLFKATEKYKSLIDNYKFQNNAIYHQSIFLMNGDTFLHNDILMIRPNDSLYSPISVLNYQVYNNLEHAKEIIESHKPDLQCLLSHKGQLMGSIPFGSAQKPDVEQYADGVNTLEFLLSLA